jgi:hypothetical protein
MTENSRGYWDGIKVRYLKDLQNRDHNILENRNVPDAHSQSAISGLVGNYLPLSGGTMTGDLNMDIKRLDFHTNGLPIRIFSLADQLFLEDTLNLATLSQLDAGDISRFRRSGQYYSMPYAGNNGGTGALAAQLMAIPFIVTAPLGINSIALEVTTNGGPGSLTRLGLYADNGSVYPGSLLKDAGVTDNSGTGVKEIAISPSLSPLSGLYWIAGAFDGLGNFKTIANPVNVLGTTAGNFDFPGASISKTGSYTASLPSTFPNGAGVGAAAVLMQVKIV